MSYSLYFTNLSLRTITSRYCSWPFTLAPSDRPPFQSLIITHYHSTMPVVPDKRLSTPHKLSLRHWRAPSPTTMTCAISLHILLLWTPQPHLRSWGGGSCFGGRVGGRLAEATYNWAVLAYAKPGGSLEYMFQTGGRLAVFLCARATVAFALRAVADAVRTRTKQGVCRFGSAYHASITTNVPNLLTHPPVL
jgi:hypothetical protein